MRGRSDALDDEVLPENRGAAGRDQAKNDRAAAQILQDDGHLTFNEAGPDVRLNHDSVCPKGPDDIQNACSGDVTVSFTSTRRCGMRDLIQ